jgi:protein TonB
VPTGNTLYGKAPAVAPDPKAVEPYAAEGTAPPPPRLSAQPRLLEQPEVPYPPEARRTGVEGQVKLLLRIDRQGRVVSARILADPGGGLGEAARDGALRFHFSPGLLDGEPVEVPDFAYTYTFVLE